MFTFSLTLFAFTGKAQQNAATDAVLLDFYQNQRYAEAADYLKKSNPEPVTDLKTLSRLAYTNRMAGNLPEAESYYLRIYARDSSNISVLLSLAGIQVKKQNNPKALFYYEKAVQTDSSNFSVLKQLGELYLDKPDTAAALKNLQKANRIQPQEADVAADLGLLLAGMKKEKQAEIVLNRALAADSSNMLLLHTLAKAAYINDGFKSAIKTCETLKILGDVSAETLDMLATSYYSVKVYDCAIENFNLLPIGTERTHYLTAMSYKALKNYQMAADYFIKTLGDAISPYTDVYYDELAAAYEHNHQLKNAVGAYQKGLFFKDKPIIYYTLACLYDQDLHDKKSAVKYFKKYVASKPPEKQQPYVAYSKSRILELNR